MAQSGSSEFENLNLACLLEAMLRKRGTFFNFEFKIRAVKSESFQSLERVIQIRAARIGEVNGAGRTHEPFEGACEFSWMAGFIEHVTCEDEVVRTDRDFRIGGSVSPVPFYIINAGIIEVRIAFHPRSHVRMEISSLNLCAHFCSKDRGKSESAANFDSAFFVEQFFSFAHERCERAGGRPDHAEVRAKVQQFLFFLRRVRFVTTADFIQCLVQIPDGIEVQREAADLLDRAHGVVFNQRGRGIFQVHDLVQYAKLQAMGQFLVILSAFGFSTLGVFGKLAYESGFTRDQMLYWRFLFAAPAMFLILLLTKSSPRNARSFFSAVLVGMIGIGVEATLYFITLEHLGVALTAILLYLYPAFVAILSFLFLKEKHPWQKWACILLSLAGSILTVGLFGGGESVKGAVNPMADPVGLFFGVATGFWYAIYLLAGARASKDENPLVVSTGIVLGALVTFTALAFWEADQSHIQITMPAGGKALWSVLGMGIIASVVPFASLYTGMKKIGPVLTSILSTLELVFSIILAAVLLGEKLTVMQGVGASLILLSVLLASLIKRE